MAPSINAAIAAYDQGNALEGVSAYQAKILRTIAEAGLSEVRNVICERAAAHPHNRDGAGLVPVDAHELLSILVEKGWDDAETAKALACEIHAARATPRATLGRQGGGTGMGVE